MNNDRIAIVGLSGSGKSTFANKLGKKLQRPVIHLDKYYWTKDWKERYQTKEEFRSLVDSFVNEEFWIIDGNYRSTIDNRLERATTIVHFDLPKIRCLWRAINRVFNREQPIDKPEGAKEKIGWELVKFILNYPKHEMKEKVLKQISSKKVYIVRNNSEINQLLNIIN